MDLFSLTTLEICEGQQLDMEFESRCDVTEDEYIEMIRLKTAVLLAAASLKTGALLAGATARMQKIYIILVCRLEYHSNYRMICWMYMVIRKCSERK